MKVIVLIFIFLSLNTSNSQSNPDSLKINQNNDSLPFSFTEFPISNIDMFPDSIFKSSITSSISCDWRLTPVYDTIPNCAELINRDGLFYLQNDTLPYCAVCVVLHSKVKHSVIAQYNGVIFFSSMLHPPNESNWSNAYFITQGKEQIKILSSYKNGKRDGPREYYSTKGKLIKIENYTKGKLKSSRFIN